MSINCDGVGVRVSGTTLDVIQDFTNIVSGVRKALLETFAPETTDELIALCGQLAYASAHEDRDGEAEIYKRISEALVNASKP